MAATRRGGGSAATPRASGADADGLGHAEPVHAHRLVDVAQRHFAEILQTDARGQPRHRRLAEMDRVVAQRGEPRGDVRHWADAVYVQRVPAVPSIFVAPTPARPEFTPTCSTIGSSSGSAALMSFARCSSAIAVATAARA